MTSQNPNQTKPNDSPDGRETGPRFDDRPTPRREGGGPDSTKGTKERSGEKPGPGPGLPDYGDQEPGDPRRIDIESGGSGGGRPSERQGGGTRS